MRRRFTVLLMVAGLAACTERAEVRASAAGARLTAVPSIVPPASLTLVGRLAHDGAEWRAAREATDSVGLVVGDSAIRLRLWPTVVTSDDVPQPLCGAVALGRVPLMVRTDTLRLPADTIAPALGLRAIGETERVGVRWIVPGAQAQYHFEGVTRDGRQRVSFRWPVRTDASVRIPVGAPDSVIEAALRPSPDSLDAFIQRVVATGQATPVVLAPSDGAPRQADAVPLVSDLPFFTVPLSMACPAATFRLTVLARTDQRLRIPVKAGDEIDAFASAAYGAVQLWIEEAGPPPASERFANVPRARAQAAADGVVTVHLTLLTVSKQQRADQEVLVRLMRRHP